MTKTWSIDWSHGRATVHAGAGAIGHTELLLDDGRRVDPFHEAPWISSGEAIEPGFGNLRGDWPCLPFGHPYAATEGLEPPWSELADAPLPAGASPLVESDRLQHGYSAQGEWTLVSNANGELVVGIEYPADSPIGRLTRRLRPVEGEAAMDVSVEIAVRRPCIRPFGFHPNFALRGGPGSFRIEPGRFQFGRTHPAVDTESKSKPDTRFSSLADVALKAGGSARFDLLPFADGREDILQLCGIDGHMRLVDEHARVAWDLSWDSAQLGSCLLWMSNRGRQYAPWNGRNLCLGVEPIASAFDLGTVIANAANPIAEAGVRTALPFTPGSPTTIGYRISGKAL